MLWERKQSPELLQMKTKHDSDNSYFDYEKDILNKSLSPYIFANTTMAKFLTKLQPLVSLLFDHTNVIKNFKNYMVDKYHYKQKG